jgi:hypothetical protein
MDEFLYEVEIYKDYLLIFTELEFLVDIELDETLDGF